MNRTRNHIMYWLPVVVLTMGLAGAGCGATDMRAETPDPNAPPPPPCNPPEAPFAKVVNPSTAAEFEGCTVTAQVDFNSADWGVAIGADSPGFVKWSAMPAGTTDFKALLVTKAKSDIIFTLKKGDRLTIKGFPRVYFGSQVMFYAYDVQRGK